MANYQHYVSGFFAYREAAQAAQATLLKRGLNRTQLELFESNVPASDPAPRSDSNAVLKDMLIDGSIGTAAGAGIGALAEVALVAANVSLFVASPLIAPLAMLGWGASLGALMGAATGALSAPETSAKQNDGKFSELVRDAIANGQIVLLAVTRDEQESEIARQVLKAAVGDFKETVAT